VAITALLEDARLNLQTGAGSARDERLYIDPRGKVYPDVSRDTRNFIDRGDCESTDLPGARGEIGSYDGTSAARDSTVSHSGEYSIKHVTDGAATRYVFLDDNGNDTTDMHGYLPGETVEAIVWMYVPSTGGPSTISECALRIGYYADAAWTNVVAEPTTYDTWEKLTARIVIADNATGFRAQTYINSAASATEFYYIDDISVHRFSTFTENPHNAMSRGSCENPTVMPRLNSSSAGSTDMAKATSTVVARSGKRSWRITKSASGTDYLYFTNGTADTYYAASETIYFSIWLYIPSSGGFSTPEVGFYMSVREKDETATNRDSNYTAASYAPDLGFDKWFQLSFEHTMRDDMQTFGLMLRTGDNAANPGEICYYDDVECYSKRSGSHRLTGGYTSHLMAMPDAFTFQMKFRSTFAYDVTASRVLCGWYNDSTHYWFVYYYHAIDKFLLVWYDGGASSWMYSAQYDDGASYRNVNQWITMTIAFDPSAGQTGCKLWMDKTLDDEDWGKVPDSKSSEFNRFAFRIANTTGNITAEIDVAFARMFPDYVATDADVQNDFKDVTAEEIFFPFDGHATGKTRVNITRFYTRQMSLVRSCRTLLAGSYGANKFNATLNNTGGKFSDDQYGTYDPTTDSFNGDEDQQYLRKRFRVELESWYDGEFDPVFIGRVTRGGLRRDSTRKNVSFVSLSAEDTAADLGEKPITRSQNFEDCKLSDTIESNSLLHRIARLGRPTIKQYLANNSFEDATITDAWQNSSMTSLSRVAGSLFGTYVGEAVNATGTDGYLIQDVTFQGTEKLSVGQTFTFSIWLKSAGAISDATGMRLQEYAGGAFQYGALGEISISGGEGWVKHTISHTITGSTSEQLKVRVKVLDGDTMQFDGAQLIPGDRALDLFGESSYQLNGAASSGAVSADWRDEIAWDEFGFRASLADYVHPWPTVEEGTTVWENLKPLFDALVSDYGGFDESGCLLARGYLDSDREEPIATYAFSDESGESMIRNKLRVSLNPISGNKIIGHGVKIAKHGRTIYRPAGNEVLVVAQRVLWQASATDHFTESLEGLILNVAIADDDYFPDLEEYPEYWAKLGDTEDKVAMFRDLWSKFKAGDLAPDMRNEIHMFDRIHGTLVGVAPQIQYFGSGGAGFYTGSRDLLADSPAWQPNGPAMELVGGEKLIGVTDADLLHKLSDTGADGNSALTEESGRTMIAGLDVISRVGFARILLRNETGAEVAIIDAGIVGRPVTVYSDDSGYRNEFFSLPEDIAQRGEKRIEFGNRFILGDVREANDTANPTHLDIMSEYWAEYSFTRRHIFSFPQNGSRFYISPGRWASFDIGDQGEAEYTNVTAVVTGITISRTPSGIGTSNISIAEVKQGFVSSFARDISAFSASGKKPRTHRSHVTVASKYHIGEADFRCTGSDDQNTINAAIQFMSGAYGGGEVRLTEGSFHVEALIDMASNVKVVGQGYNTQVIRYTGTYAVRFNSVSNATLEAMILQSYVSDSSTSAMVYLTGGSGNEVNRLLVSSPSGVGIHTEAPCAISFCRIIDPSSTGVLVEGDNVQVTDTQIDSVTITTAFTWYGILALGNQNIISRCTINDATITTGSAVGIYFGDKSTISECVVFDLTATTKSVGISAENDDPAISNCVIRDCDLGIDLIASTSTVNGCRIVGCADGIDVTGSDNIISGNMLNSGSGTGLNIQVSGSNNAVTGNRVTAYTTANYADAGTATTNSGNDFT